MYTYTTPLDILTCIIYKYITTHATTTCENILTCIIYEYTTTHGTTTCENILTCIIYEYTTTHGTKTCEMNWHLPTQHKHIHKEAAGTDLHVYIEVS